MRNQILTSGLPVLVLSILAFAGPALTATTTRAPTQSLALVANDEPVPLRCAGADCSAEFSAFCLEPGKASPARGAAYRLQAAGTIRLTGHTADGRALALDPAAHLAIAALRTHVAVRMSVPQRTVRELDLRRVTLSVGRDAILLPAPVPGSGEIAAVSQKVRALGGAFVDRDRERMAAARITSRMINALPTPAQSIPEDRAGLWRATVRDADFARMSSAAQTLVSRTHDYCLDGARTGLFPSMRRCLQAQHDRLVGGLNKRFWDALNAGS